ncbi:hypothetical protein IPE29_004138 [Salmonella enterica subsp. diarizonae serovar Rough:-:-]|nr:hypothetical protein [Salmonella enterica subsp. diarizonae]ECA1939739.1 hypothetical protein [Salmonella enterica subsp. enterica serovar Enteritidis]ECY5113375.1 hypothetical protein [Salmonella enterica subsp. enterica serovar Typhimurium]EDJ8220967.1 hypothetical protein [Salmonella enterica]EEM3072813.1 hypothetical protein [Salmonella enterica subsp. enterica serovar Java]EGO1766500.1 hypothetical protein [Salmonella enterica subsp. diarizonae serovar Rough:-:-]
MQEWSMKTETPHDVTSADIRLHQKRGHRALRLEMAGDYTAAALAWQHAANKAPLPQWRIFARERSRCCKNRNTTRSRQGCSPGR